MSMRPKTKRRLAILVMACLLIAAAGFGLWSFRQHQLQTRIAEAREQGLAAFEQGDYATALRRLSFYVGREKEDVEALYAYGYSRAEIEEPNNRHIAEAIGVFRRVIEIDPNHAQTQKKLLELFMMAGYFPEAIELSERLLEQNGADPEALRHKSLALFRLNRIDDALATSEHLNEVAPLDIEGQVLTMELMAAKGLPGAAVLQQYQQRFEQHSDDPRFQLLLAIAHAYNGNEEEAEKWIDAAAAAAPPDEAFVRTLVRVLDDSGRFEQSQRVLERAAVDSTEIRQMLVRRLWQNGRRADVIERVEQIPDRLETADAELLGFYALSLQESNRPEEAADAVEALSQRQHESAAQAWATALAAAFSRDQLGPLERIAEYRSALHRDSGNAVIRFMLAEALLELGETELAIREWRRAAEDRRDWAAPLVQVAITLNRTGRFADATQEALHAHRRAPRHLGARIAYALAAAPEAVGGDEQKRQELLAFVDAIQSRVEGGEPQTLPLYVALLARNGQQDRATEVIQQVMQMPRPHGQDVLLGLATVSRDEQLGHFDDLLEYTEQAHGLTPQIAQVRAWHMRESGQAAEGLQYLESARRNGRGSEAEWDLMLATYRERIGHEDAVTAWTSAGDKHPKNLAVQRAAAQSPAARTDRPFMARTIDRIRDLTGDDGLLWKQERARWLIHGGQDTRERDVAEAVHILNEIVSAAPQLVEPRLLLGVAYHELGNTTGALEQYQKVLELNPRLVEMQLAVAQMLREQGQTVEALQRANEIYQRVQNRSVSLTTEQRGQLSQLLASLGQHNRATEVLASAPDGQDSLQNMLQLAELERAQGNLQAAERHFRNAVEHPDAGPQAFRAAADFFASTGQMDLAASLLDRLPGTNLSPDQQELLRGEFAERHINPQQARRHYEAATQIAPNNANNWRNLVGFHLRQLDFAQAASALDRAIQLHPADGDLPRLRRRNTILQQAQLPAELRRIVAGMLPDLQTVSVDETFQRIESRAQRNQPLDQLVTELRQVARRDQRNFPLQHLVVRGLIAIGQRDLAADMATQVMNATDVPEAARLAIDANAEAQRYRNMLAAAQEWRRRAPNQAAAADVAIADAHTLVGNPQAALRQLQPYAQAARDEPDKHAAIIMAWSRALIANNNAAEAADLLAPLAEAAPDWRIQAIRLAETTHNDRDQARRWMQRFEPMVNRESPQELLTLAQVWQTIGHRFDDQEAMQAAREAVLPLVERSDAPAAVFLLMALASDHDTDTSEAVSYYRQAIQRDPNLVLALNNLAYLLMGRGELEEAGQLATRAAQLAPFLPHVHDTLGEIQARSGQVQESMRSFRRALELDHAKIDSRIGLAYVLAQDSNRHHEARAELDQIEHQMSQRASPTLPDYRQKQLEELKQTLRPAASIAH
jgi:tetratricopeptide (TPR) repeat protein